MAGYINWKGMNGIAGLTELLHVLIWAVVSWVHMPANVIELHKGWYSLLHVNKVLKNKLKIIVKNWEVAL